MTVRKRRAIKRAEIGIRGMKHQRAAVFPHPDDAGGPVADLDYRCGHEACRPLGVPDKKYQWRQRGILRSVPK